MAVKIIAISPKPDKPSNSNESISAHLSIDAFQWINESDQQTGISSRALMFDWIVNKKGRAFIKKGEYTIFVFGANAINGQYIRTINEGQWTDDLLDLPLIAKTQT